MRILAATITLLVMLAVAGPASATTNPTAAATVRCVDGQAVATFTYSGFAAANHLTATQQLVVTQLGWRTLDRTFEFDGPGSTDTMTMELGRGQFWLQATTTVTGGAGRVKAEALINGYCATPPPPPPPSSVHPTAGFWGPCGDPFYRAILNNRRSDRAVTFRVNWKPFGDPRRNLVRRVAAHQRVLTGLFDVAGSTRMYVYWVRPGTDRLLASKMSAPNRIYGTCPAGVPIIR